MTRAQRVARDRALALAIMLATLVMAMLLYAAEPAHAATFTVTNTNGGGAGSLRQAVEDANANAGADTIKFNIPGNGPHTIAPDEMLPEITGPVTIDGYSQGKTTKNTTADDAKPNTLAVGNNAVLKIELSGVNAGPNESGLRISAANSTVKGLVINSWGIFGVQITGSGATGNKVMGNYIGTDAAGTSDLGNGAVGVYIQGAPDNTIGGTTAGARNIISGNDEAGVRIDYVAATGNKVMGNYIGTDKTGTAALGNSLTGVWISDAPKNTIGGTTAGARNIISGNDSVGLFISGTDAPGNKVMGNYIGTDAAGTQALGNFFAGVFIAAPNNTVGGTVTNTSNPRNVISGNDPLGEGVKIGGLDATGNKVMGNYIGTDKTGTADLGNSLEGVYIEGAPNNTIGGTKAGARNIISGNSTFGIRIYNPDATGNKVMGNYIGTDKTGTADLGNSFDGVRIYDAPNNSIGDTTAGARNIISGNNQSGVNILGLGVTVTPGSKVMGNYIGTDKTGTADLGNSRGVTINDAPNNTIGDTTAGARNIISGNDFDGVLIFGNFGSSNRVLSNSIHSNGGLGINLFGGTEDVFGVTANDSGDGDGGSSNNLQNYPVLTSAKTTKLATTIKGTLNSTASTTFTIQFFSSPAADQSGFGEGQKFKGSKSVTTDGSGNATFTFKTKKKVAKGQVVSATATNQSTGDTSEFSLGKQVS